MRDTPDPATPRDAISEHGAWVLGNILHRIRLIEQADPIDYELRNRLVIKAVYMAKLYDIAAGFRVDPDEPHWPIAQIELPTGQVAWHLRPHPAPWDGHTTAMKHGRIARFVEVTR